MIRISGRVGDEEILLRACERLRELLFEPEVAEKVCFRAMRSFSCSLFPSLQPRSDFVFHAHGSASFSAIPNCWHARWSSAGTCVFEPLLCLQHCFFLALCPFQLVISRFTKALLHFPSHSEESSHTLFFYFTGQPDSILKARRYVQVRMSSASSQN